VMYLILAKLKYRAIYKKDVQYEIKFQHIKSQRVQGGPQ